MKFSDILEMWWNGYKIDLRDITIIHRRASIDVHILPYFGHMDIPSITDTEIVDFISYERQCKKICQNSIIVNLRIVRWVLDYAVQKGEIERNPFELVKKLKREPTAEFAIYSPDEVRRLIDASRPKWLGDMILLVYRTGLRKCECFGLQWCDINFEGKYLTVTRGVTATKPGERLISDPKTRSSRRVVLLDDVCVDLLTDRYNKRASDVWVFADKTGSLLSPWYLVNYFNETRSRAEIQGKRFYDLRHTHITELVSAGIPLPVIQKRVGHANINMTMHYVHVGVDTQKAVVELLNQNKIQ